MHNPTQHRQCVLGALGFWSFLNDSFCYAWLLGVEHTDHCVVVVQGWWHWNFTTTGGGRAVTREAQSSGLSFCQAPPALVTVNDSLRKPHGHRSFVSPSWLLTESSCVWNRMLISSGPRRLVSHIPDPWQLSFCFPFSKMY